MQNAAEYYRANETPLYIETASGKKFYLDAPEFDIEDIAAATSKQCRYTGHVSQFYSVAEHQILVSEIMELSEGGDPFEGLNHDDQEAYISDIASPWKSMLPDYKKLEERLEKPLRRWLGIPETITPECKHADWIALFLEADSLMPSRAKDWIAPPGIKERAIELRGKFWIRAWTPATAEREFLARFKQLKFRRDAE